MRNKERDLDRIILQKIVKYCDNIDLLMKRFGYHIKVKLVQNSKKGFSPYM